MADIVRVEATVTGHVQGVGFRAWVRDAAGPLGLVGSAVNRPDGSVRVVAEGERAACELLLAAVRGPQAPGRVATVEVDPSPARGDLTGFATG